MDYRALKSGTDIRGTAIAEDTGKIDLTYRAVYDLTVGFMVFLGKKSPVIAVGHDSRLSANTLMGAVTDALRDYGCYYYDCGLTSTPAMFMSTRFEETNCDGAIMLTASHHPFDKNGMKFFTPEGGLSGAQLSEVISNADVLPKASGEGRRRECDLMGLYKHFLMNKLQALLGEEKPLCGMKIAVDAGNGSGGFFAEVLSGLGADVSASQFLEPDGRFPNHIPNPENAEAMHFISSAVVKNNCDLGIIFDTDADRAAIVTADGKEINRNRLIAMMSAIVLEKTAGATIVTDSVTSSGLTDFIVSHGGKHLRYRRGYRNVIDKAIELESKGIDAPLAIETSGHGALKENYYLDDGAYMALLLVGKAAKLRQQGKELGFLIKDLVEPVEEGEFRFKLICDEWKDLGNKIISDLTELGKSKYELKGENFEGVRIYLKGGWFMLRQSVHDPVLVANFEGEEKGITDKMRKILYDFLSSYKGLDANDIKKLMN